MTLLPERANSESPGGMTARSARSRPCGDGQVCAGNGRRAAIGRPSMPRFSNLTATAVGAGLASTHSRRRRSSSRERGGQGPMEGLLQEDNEWND